MPEFARVFRKASVATLVFTLFVIVWGALVRATGSGAGCGEHWPLCNGEVVPQDPTTHTFIEFTHRATSGLSFLAVLALALYAWKRFPKGAPARATSAWALFFMVTEALIGAGLVLFGLVAGNDSLLRAGAIALHLVNTLFLLGALALLAFTDPLRPEPAPETRGSVRKAVGACLVLFFALGVTGAVTALGDTLFPKTSVTLAEARAHFLTAVRWVHPTFAGLCGAFFIWTHAHFDLGRPGARFISFVLASWAVGVLNLFLLAPVALQLLHLLVADLGWIALVLMGHSVGFFRFGTRPA